MELVEKFAIRIDNDNGYDNLSLAQDLAEIAEEHYSEKCNIPHVGLTLPDSEAELFAEWLNEKRWRKHYATDNWERTFSYKSPEIKTTRELYIEFKDN